MITGRPIEQSLYHFLSKVLAERSYDLIVCVERKATAVLRALIQEVSEPRLNWPWASVLSSAAIDAFDWDSFEGHRVLLFEELVHHGKSLKDCYEKLSGCLKGKAEIYSAGFGVWERCQSEPDSWYRAGLNDEEFEEMREEIIAALQRYGSLLLDTEHIELVAKLECGMQDFFGELARCADDGNTFSFVSGAKRSNVTIVNPAIVKDVALQRILTPGSSAGGAVNKCRVLERTYNRFSIIPILYPNTRHVIDAGWIEGLPAFVRRDAVKRAKPAELFYLVGLLASIELLRGVVAALGEFVRKGRVGLEVPQENFAHLAAMFPNVDIMAMWAYVKGVVLESKRLPPLHSRRAVEVRHVPEDSVKRLAFDFFDRLLENLDERETWESPKGNPVGVSCAELGDIARDIAPRQNLPFGDVPADRVIAAVGPDRLIDSGFVVTKVEEVTDSRGGVWAIRTFRPDAEVVTLRFRRQVAVRGNPWR